MNNLIILFSAIIVTGNSGKDDTSKTRHDTGFIGQGDEDIELSHNELRKSTSMFINHLFDMSDVENVTNYNEPDISTFDIKDAEEHDEAAIKVMEIIESYVNNALNIVCEEIDRDDSRSNYCELPDSTDNSSYSLLSDAVDISKNMNLNINDDEMLFRVEENGENQNQGTNPVTNASIINAHEADEKNKKDAALYENAYLTLNRDYDQLSEEDEPVLQDSKLPMQEVELQRVDTSFENVTQNKVQKEEIVCGMSTSAAGSRKSSLARRCRIQGARLLSCFRGWWWSRKLLGKRKDSRLRGSIRDLMKPLSPDARRRTASLLDQRNLRTPSPSRPVIWKFNTVNEALVHSSRWKEFGIKMSLNENDEF